MGRVAWENPGGSRDYHVTVEAGTTSQRVEADASNEESDRLVVKLVKLPKLVLAEKRKES